MLKIKNKWITKNPTNRLYNIPVPIIGLTGGIATGKSTVAQFFRKKNIPVIDADQLVKNIYKKKETFDFIKETFPDAIEKDAIKFSYLREIAFKQSESKKIIENFIYARLPEEFMKAYEKIPTSSFIVYDVPLLFERGLEQAIDLTICVYAPRKIQIERLKTRDCIDVSLIERILNEQLDIEDKKLKSDFIIENGSDLQNLEKNCKTIFEQITQSDA